jgi:hypothetical protein
VSQHTGTADHLSHHPTRRRGGEGSGIRKPALGQEPRQLEESEATAASGTLSAITGGNQ